MLNTLLRKTIPKYNVVNGTCRIKMEKSEYSQGCLLLHTIAAQDLNLCIYTTKISKSYLTEEIFPT